MSCNLNSGNFLSCRGVGGVEEVFLADWSKVVYGQSLTNEILEVTEWADGIDTYSQYIVKGVKDKNDMVVPDEGYFIEIYFPSAPFDVLNDTGLEVVGTNYDPITNILSIKTKQPIIATGSTVGLGGIILNSAEGDEITEMPNIAFYSIMQPREVAEWIENPMSSLENHSSWFEKTITISLYNVASTNSFVNILVKGKWIVMVKDTNGSYWIINKTTPAKVNSGSGGSGKLMLDMNGYIINIEVKEGISTRITDFAIQRFINSGGIV
jgi:hypothetical protein